MKRIVSSVCPALALIILSGGCAGEPFTMVESNVSAGAGAGGGGATSGAAGSGGVSSGGSGGLGAAGLGVGGVNVAGTAGASGPSGEQIELDIAITSDGDDATWVLGIDERLRFGSNDPSVEVGTDAEAARSGFRFALPVPRGARVESAVLRLSRVDGNVDEDETLLVKVYDAPHVEPFDEGHVHAPEAHAAGGFWPPIVGGFRAGRTGEVTESPDLSELVQHVIDRSDWTSGNAVGLALFPDDMNGWASYRDSSSGAGGARLRVVYRTP